MPRIAAVFAGFAILYLVLDRTAAALLSYRGEAGITVCLAVLLAVIVVAFVLWRTRPLHALRDVGLRPPQTRALIWSVVLAAALLCFFPLYSWMAGTPVTLRADAALLAFGIFAQGGIAEEVVFRGFLFRHMRDGRSFWRAAMLSAIPFVAVHLLLFATMDFAVALAALSVALSLSFPLAWLFERSGNSIWPGALVHAVVQGAIKLVEADGAAFMPMAVTWMALSALAPWAFFLLRPKPA